MLPLQRMSGTTTSYPFPLTLGVAPSEGSKGVSVSIPWATVVNPFSINLLTQFQSGQFSTPQAVWVDNSSVPWPIVISCEQQQQNIWVPRFTQGMFPLIVGQAPIFSVQQLTNSLGGNTNPPLGTTQMTFLNGQQQPWQQPAQLSLYQWSSSIGSASSGVALQVLGVPGTGFYRMINSVQLAVGAATATTATQIVTITLGESGGSTFYTDLVSVASGTVGIFYRSGILNYSSPPLLTFNNGIWFFCNAPVTGANISFSLTIDFTLVQIE